MNEPTPSSDSLAKSIKKCLKNTDSDINLQRITINTITLALWKNHDIDHKISEFFNTTGLDAVNNSLHGQSERWNQVEETVWKNAKSLDVPSVLRCELEYSVAMTGAQITSWMRSPKGHALYKWRKCDYINGIVWTRHGTINKKKSVQFLLNNIIFHDKINSVRLAFNYCMEDDIKTLWIELLPLIKQWDYDQLSQFLSMNVQISRYWRSFIAGEELGDEAVEEIFYITLLEEFDVAADYFWGKMTLEGRDRMITKWCLEGPEFEDPDILFFFFRRCSEEQLSALIQAKPDVVFKCFLLANRPWRKCLLSIVIKELLDFVSYEHRWSVFVRLVVMVARSGLQGCLYKVVLEEIWNSSDCDWRLAMLKRYSNIMVQLLSVKDLDFLNLMFKDVEEEEKLGFLRKVMQDVFRKVVRDGKRALQEFLETAFESGECLNVFKKEFAVYGMQSIRTLLREDKYEVFFEFCGLSEEDLVQLRNEFCSFEIVVKIVKDFSGSGLSVDWDKFLSWCSFSKVEMKQLNKLRQS